ncbi:hypothetical protein CONLIGDRAFT_317872 [Coniochaeta ligniaria NRRL 30616]|uniref:Cupin type-2 domain-containing protein n=1 Tax=Coniochaeta ligniaria NRRL 30616 TaxID=1408157 RepID=A0A1J7IVA6_9PEZI|nr:hypothetical protein CONLIGDRAFT_317872 [Coniochaeta ligniaria NRRL 30616]
MGNTHPPVVDQPPNNMPDVTVYATGHSPDGKAVLHSKRPAVFSKHDEDRLRMAVGWTTSFPSDLNGDADVAVHEKKMSDGPFGLVLKGGTVLRYVDMAPGYECMMHRTQSVDYGIVLEGEVVGVMGSGEEYVMKRGDVTVQRATMHAWRNDSETKWARMIFALQDCKPLVVGGKRLGEDLGTGSDVVPASGNDVDD